MAKPLSFKDMISPDVLDGEDDLTRYRDAKRRKTSDADEALNIQQRMKRSRLMKRLAPKIKRGQERAKRKMASKDVLQRRAQKAARKAIIAKLYQGKDKASMPASKKAEIEKRLDKPQIKKRISMLAKRMVKDVRKKEQERKRGSK